MGNPLVREQTPIEYFKELVEASMARQHVQAADLTEYYLVNLLCQYVRPNRTDSGEPLAIRLARALESGGSEQRARLRGVGDFSLFMSGFFSESLAMRSVDVDYYKSMGEYAYGSLSRRRLRRARPQVRRLHGRPRRYQRADDTRIHDRGAASL
jgi:hypothetical protein